MRTSTLICFALTAAMSPLLAACGGSQPPIGAPGAMTQTSAIATRADRGTSWMLPEAKGENLLYVASGGNQSVYVFSYPRAKLVGTLTGFDWPTGLCSDNHGNLFVTDNEGQDIVEYAHGGTVPIATLSDSGYDPTACSFDPTTGNLAVANSQTTQGGSSTGNIAIYANAEGAPTDYADSAMRLYFNCGYDNKGNLFLDGLDATQSSVFAELPARSGTFANLGLPFYDPGPIQWDGKALAVATSPFYEDSTIYRLSVVEAT